MRKRLLTFLCLLLGMGATAMADGVKVLVPDQAYTSIADVGNNIFAIVNTTDKKAIYNSDNQNLKYDVYKKAFASTNAAYYWKLESLDNESDASVHGLYRLRIVKTDGNNVSFWGSVNEAFLNSGDPDGTHGANPFNGHFVLGFGSKMGQDMKYGGVYEVEYVADKGFTLKNKALGGYFAGPGQAATASNPVYWTFCSLKETEEENPIAVGSYDATDANTADFANFKTIAGDATYDAETKVFTKTCGWEWDGDGLDLSRYRYIVITAGSSRDQAGDGYMTITDNNGVTVGGDDYGEAYQNMWFSTWNHLFCCKIDIEKLRQEKTFDIRHIKKLTIDGGGYFLLGTAFATNTEPRTRNRWGQDDEGSYRITGLTANKFGKIKLPYQAAVACAEIYEIESENEDGYKVKKHTGLLDAGVTYIYRTTQNTSDAATENKVFFYQATAATLDGVTLEHKALKASLSGDFLTVQTIKKGAYDATDANTTFFANFGPIGDGANYDATTKKFTGNCGWQWSGNGLDLDKYQYIVITVAQNVIKKGCQVHIKDKSGIEVSGDNYGAPYMNMWIGNWNNHNCLKIDVEKLRTEKEFDIHHIAELWIEAGDGLILGNAYATNQVPENNKNWNNEEKGDFKVSIANNSYGVVRLPFPASVAGAFVYEIDNITSDGIQIGNRYDGILQAGKRYIFKTNENENVGNADENNNAGAYFYKATAQTVTTTQEGFALCGTLEGNVFKLNNVPFNGSYYVQNAESGLFMSAGHDWGTQAIVDEVGLDLTLAANEFNFVTFDSKVADSDTKHFLGSNLYMDAPAYNWSIDPMGDGTYSITNGAQYIGVNENNNLAWSNTPVAWKFVSYDERLASLSAANKNNGVDATFLIKDHNFSRNNKRKSSWIVKGIDSDNSWRYGLSEGWRENNVAKVWHSNATFSVSQTIKNAPAGYYELKAQGFYNQDEGSENAPQFFIKSNTSNDVLDVLPKTGTEGNEEAASNSFTAGNYEHTLPWSAVIGDFEVGIKGTANGQWIVFDNFRLTYYGPVPAEKSQMDPALTVAKELVADANKTVGKEALSEALSAAQTAYNNIKAYNYDEFGAEVQKLEAAIKTFRTHYNVSITGVYYVQNAESGKYMSAGHNWGTRGILDQVGLDLTLAANTDKTVKFDSKVANGGDSHFLGNGLYMDASAYGWFVEKAGDDTYTISDGVLYIGVDKDDNLVMGTSPVTWKFVSMADRKAALNAATKDNGMDATFLIKDHNFGRNNQRSNAWTWNVPDGTDKKNYTLSGGETTDGSVGNNCSETYHTTFTLSQNVSDAPAGYYVLEAQGFYRQDGGTEAAPVFFINEVTKPVSKKTGEESNMTTACASFTAGKYNTVTDMSTATESLTIGIKGTAKSQWVIFDNFRLTYYGPNPAEKSQMDPALAIARKLAADPLKTEGKAELNTAIAAAETSYNNTDAMTYAEFKVEVKKLEAAIEAFKKANRIAMKGVYYVQNVASGKFMSAGHSWGTQGIVDEVGLDITMAANNDNKVSFNSQIEYNGGHFLNSAENGNLYMDQSEYSWCIEKMSDNTFSISNGTKFIGVDANENLVLVDEAVAWKFLTLENRIANLEDATEDDPMDASFLIKDNNFGRNNLRASAWQQKGINNISGGENDNGTIGNNCAESWHAVLNLSQTISNAPAGIYGLKVQGFYRQDDNLSEDAPEFFINNEKLAVLPRTGTENDMKGAANAFKEGKYDMDEPIMCDVKDGTIKVGITGSAEKQWVIFDNFRLIYYGLSGEDITNPPVVISDLVYTGEELDVITAGSHEIGTVKYTTDKENWSTELPKFTEAGTHNVWYCVFDEDGNQLLAAKKLIIRIAPAKVSNYIKASISETEFDYDGTAKEPKVTVTGKLIAGTDYTITYEDNINAGTGKALVTGQGNYGGSIVLPFNIAKIQLTGFRLLKTELVYNEEEQTVEVDSVMAGEIEVPADAYTLTGNVEMAVGTHTVTLTANEESNFYGELTAEYTIVGSPVDVCDIALDTYQYVYSGKEKKPAVTVMRGDMKLVQGQDYTLSYEDNINAGTAKAVITGIGNYAGTKATAFKITQGTGQLDMLNKEVTMEYAGSPFTVKPIVLLGDGVIRYASSNEDVAYVNYYTGEVTAKGIGQTTITINMASTPNATAAKTSYLLTVTPASSTLVTIVRLSQGYGIPAFKVSTFKETLVEGKDYILSYRDLQGHAVTEAEMLAAPGRYVAVANLQGNFQGTSELEFTVTEDPLTGIGSVEGDGNGTVRYDMGGRRVLKTHRGMVIENGKKHYMKKK